MDEQKQQPNHTDLAVSRFAGGFNCSQAVFSVFANDFGLDEKVALKIAAGFGGGVGRMGGTCGAVTGAIMVLGLRFGAATPDRETKELVYNQVQTFANRFKAINGSLACRDLLGCDISTPDGHQTAREKSLFTTVCPKLVQDAVEILEEMLAKKLAKP